jgi:hypothetical protein
MNDILIMMLVFAFFAATTGLLALCQHLMEATP